VGDSVFVVALALLLGHNAKLLQNKDKTDAQNVVERLLPIVDVNRVDKDGRTPLEILFRASKVTHNRRAHASIDTLASTLCQLAQLDINKTLLPDEDQTWALSWAMRFHLPKTVEAIVTRRDVEGIDVACENGLTPLQWTIEQGETQIVRQLCTRDDVDVNRLNSAGQTPLYHAVQIADEKVKAIATTLLASPHVDVNYIHTDTHLSALLIATQSNCITLVQRLCERPDLNPNCKTKDGVSAFNIAVKEGWTAIVLELLSRRDIDTALASTADIDAIQEAFQKGYVDILRAILDKTNLGPALVNFLDISVDHDKYDVLELFISRDLGGAIHTHSHFSVDKLAPLLTIDSAVNLLLADLPIQVSGNTVVEQESNSKMWAKCLDARTPLPHNLRRNVVEVIINHATFNRCRKAAARKLALSTDEQGRIVLQITDASSRAFINEFLFFGGRYDISDPPIHISATAVVVSAYDHGLFKQVFDEHKSELDRLDRSAAVKCLASLGRPPET
ncbi:hypothetical protein As57867_005978, partial [Aphanomyces stellatus]